VSANAPLVDAVRSALAAAGDAERAPAAQAYMKSAMPFRGVPVPQVRRTTQTLLAAHPLPDARAWHATVLALWDGAAYREERYAAIALVRSRQARPFQDMAALELYRHMVVTGAWWDFVDELAHAVGAVLRAVGPPAAAAVRAWSRDEDLWLRRVAILCQLGFRRDTDTALLLECIEANLADREFFIRKAIGWALRDYSYADPAWVAGVVEAAGDRMSPLSRREATKQLGRVRGASGDGG
jgi:3-methyladenine DNA glycosylase AlkD